MQKSPWHKVYIPEIHDIYPGMSPGAEALSGLLPAEARPMIAWSVVPNWQGRARLSDDPAATAAIAALPGQRLLHGWTHSLGPDFLNWLLYGHDNRSEFRSLSADDAAERLDHGIAEYRTAFGEAPEWFCAPRWQQNHAVTEALKARGFRGHLGRNRISIYDAPDIAMHALNFDEGDRAWRTALALRARRGTIRRLLAREAPFRLVLHPQDALHAPTRAQVSDTLAALESAGWRPLSLWDAVDEWSRAA